MLESISFGMPECALCETTIDSEIAPKYTITVSNDEDEDVERALCEECWRSMAGKF